MQTVIERKTIDNVMRCNLSNTDKACIVDVFARYNEIVTKGAMKDDHHREAST